MRMLKKRNVREDVRKTEEKKLAGLPHYRETAVTLAWQPNYKDAVLFVESASSQTWGMTKGGIDPEDNGLVVCAALRETLEEPLLDTTFAEYIRYIGSSRNNGSLSGKLDHKLQLGKRLHFVEVRFEPGPLPEVAIGHGISAVRWVTSWQEFKSLPMSDARRAHWIAAMRMVDINWARKGQLKKKKRRWD